MLFRSLRYHGGVIAIIRYAQMAPDNPFKVNAQRYRETTSFLSNFSHVLTNPLALITMMTATMAQRITQTVLRLLETDIIMKTRLSEDVTVVRSDVMWFGPSLPHLTMITVLRYYGVSDRWIGFFKRLWRPQCGLSMTVLMLQFRFEREEHQ